MNNSGRSSKKSAAPAGKEAPPDRRVQKTRKLLSEAFVSLVLEKGYDAVTIQDVITRANVGRSTFYFHFESKEQLMLWGHDHLAGIFSGPRGGQGAEGDAGPGFRFLEFFRHASENRDLAGKLLGSEGGRAVLNYLTEVFRHGIGELHRGRMRDRGKDPRLAELDIEAAAAALAGLVHAWMRKGMDVPPEAMARHGQSILDRFFGT